MTGRHRVVIETGKQKVFASAVDWPGWSRWAKTEDGALRALADYAARYDKVAQLAGAEGVTTAAGLDVVERAAGTATTDFGAPDRAAAFELAPMPDPECERLIDLLRACWAYFDAAAGRVSEELRKGPRGGGRDRTKLVEHTLEAERSYARQIGVRTPKGGLDDGAGRGAHREAVCGAVRAANAAGGVATKWPVRYLVRRAAWHVMDHAWELEDRDLTGRDR